MASQVLLFNTPNFLGLHANGQKKDNRIPLSLAYISAFLKKYNYTTRIIDLNFEEQETNLATDTIDVFTAKVFSMITEEDPLLIGFTCLFSKNFSTAITLAQHAKHAFPSIPIAIGGLHPTLFAKDILANCPFIDYIVLGEGEYQTLALMDKLTEKRDSLNDINGIAYRKGREIIISPKTAYIDDLDALPIPDYEGINLSLYESDTTGWYNPKKMPISVVVPLLTSRSCPNKCNFCGMYRIMGPRLRIRSAEHVLEEIHFLYEKYNTNYFCIEDDNFTFYKKRAIEICNGIVKRNLKIQFDTRNGLMVKTLDRDIIDAMAKAGLLRAYLAIESGSPFIRNKVMGKGLSDNKRYEVVELFRNHPHIHLFTFFMLGMPEETSQTMEETYNMLKNLDIDGSNLNYVTPYPGTKLYDQCVRDNLLTEFSPSNNWEVDTLYHGNDHIFIKPYALNLDDLRNFHHRCSKLIEEKIHIASAHGRRLSYTPRDANT